MSEWDLHANDRMHGFPEGEMITPQWRFRSNSKKLPLESLLFFGFAFDDAFPLAIAAELAHSPLPKIFHDPYLPWYGISWYEWKERKHKLQKNMILASPVDNIIA